MIIMCDTLKKGDKKVVVIVLVFRVQCWVS